MKCSPFSKDLKKHDKYHRRFIAHQLQSRMNDCVMSSSSDEEHHGMHHRMKHGKDIHGHEKTGHCTKNKIGHIQGPLHGMRHGHGMKHGIRHGHDIRHGMKHGHGMRHGMKHGHGMRHGMKHDHGMEHGMRHGHGMEHGMRHGHDMEHGMRHGHDMGHEMRHDHGMRHGHGMDHGMRHAHGMKHMMKHGHGMRHFHGRKHRMTHGPGMHHKMRKEMGRICSYNQSQGSSRPVQVENMNESCENTTATFYKPKTSAEILNENNKFQIILDVSYYQPEEVSVKIVESKIDISAMHESMENDLCEFHEMYRSFDIPDGVNPESITARLDHDGKLHIEATINDQDESPPTEIDIPVVLCE